MRKNDTGAAVRDLQQRLGIEVDGWYGDSTEAAVREFQERHGLIADGIAGDKTLATLRAGKADPRLLKHADIAAAAAALEVDIGCILAVNEVESVGHGFLPDGRPKILFERHVMYRQLKGDDYDAAGLAAQYPNLVNQARGGYAGGSAEHARFRTACGIDQVCAIESASWGLFQIMGYHWQALGYASAEEFMNAMQRSEADQLDAFVRFVKVDPVLHKALKSRKWAEFAKLYNGPAYKENSYDAKLAAAFTRHASSGEVA